MTKKIKKKCQQLMAALLAMVMVFTALPMDVFAEEADGDDYIEIRTIEDLYAIRNDLTANYILMNDIDLTEATATDGDWSYGGHGWNPIGSGDVYGSNSFSGIFDGNGYSIIGMNINIDNTYGHDVFLGLFAENAGVIRNLKLQDVSIDVTISYNSYNLYVGAVCGKNNSGTISECAVEGQINVCNGNIGGIAGYSYGKIEKCYNKASITATGTQPTVGGIVGKANTDVKNCYNVGNITTEKQSSYVGGIVGRLFDNGDIINCYNAGEIKSETSMGYGIAYNHTIDDTADITGSYYLSGTGSGTGTVLTAAQMKLQSLYSGFDFETVWSMGGDADYLYPELQCFIEGDSATTVDKVINSEGYIEIRTIEDLYAIRNDLTANYILMNDIDLTEVTAADGDWSYGGHGWNPIGSGDVYGSNSFSGIFDGNGYSIIGMNVDFDTVYDQPSGSDGQFYIGLFAKNTGVICNLKLQDVNLSISYAHANHDLYVGAICGENQGTISECIVEGQMSIYKGYIGGIAGYSYGKIEKCYNKASITAIGTQLTSTVGGIVGKTNTDVKNCYNVGNITTAKQSSYVGGIAGRLYGNGDIINCYNAGEIKSETSMGYGIAYNHTIDDTADITGSYYLSGTGSGTGTVLTAAQMKLQSLYSGFDFETVWTMGGDADYLYPELQCFTLAGTLGIKGDCVYLSTVTADISQIKKIDDSFTYEWFVNDVSVGTGPSYTIKASDVGKQLSVKVVGTKEYNEGTIYSEKITIGKANQTANPTIPEMLSLDDNSFEILTTSTQEYSIDNENWQKSGIFTDLEPNKKYIVYSRILENDLYLLGESIEVLEITTDRRALSGSIAIVGTSRYGDTLTADNSNVGPDNATYTNEWKRDGVVVGTGTTYTLGKSDIGHNISLSVVGSGDFVGTLTSASVAVTKTTVQLPNAPVVADKTNTSVTLVSKTGYEYSKDKITWQSSPVFTGLSVATEYTFYQRIKETDTTFASTASNGTKVTTLKNTVSAPEAPVVVDVTNTTVTLKKNDGYEYSKDGLSWQNSNVFTGLNAFTEYSFCQRIAETAVNYASAQSGYTMVMTLKNTVDAPNAPTIVSATESSVVLEPLSGYQYSMDGVNWQNSNVFEDLETLKTYKFYQRIAETEYDYASPSSEALSFKVKYVMGKTDKPILKEVTNNKIVVEAKNDCQFSIDGKTWTNSNIFTELKPNTTYYVYCRFLESDTFYAGEESDALVVTTLKNKVDKPSAPTLSSKTANSVTLTAKSGYEYSKDGSRWQTSNVFTGLSPNTSYTFYQRVAETSTNYVSEKSAGLKVTTDKKTVSTPAAPTLSSKTANSVTLTVKVGYEYSKDGITWQTSNIFTGLSPNTSYMFYQRVAETSTSYASEKSAGLSVTTSKNSVATPAAPVVRDVSATTIVLEKVAGCEYSLGGTTWQDSNIFTGLKANKTYTFYQRVKETATNHASAMSAAQQIKTANKSACSIKPAAPIVKEYTSSQIVLVARDGYEYKIGNGSWTTNPKFTGLSANTSYTVYQRIAECDEEYASEASVGVTVKTATTGKGTTAATNYDKLRNYIDTYGSTGSSGDKRIVLKETANNGLVVYYALTNTSDGIEFTLMTDSSAVSKLVGETTFVLTKSSTSISIYSSMLYYYNDKVIDAAQKTGNMNRSTYSSSDTYSFYQSGTNGYIKGSDFSENFNSTMKLLCITLDAYLYSELGFGLRGLGFTSYSGLGSTACDPLVSYHTGNTEIRNARNATCTVDGYTGDTYCTSCGEKVKTGSVIACKGYHNYTNSCDKDCNTCGEERRVTHTYYSDCDEKCDICNHTRIAPVDHTFDEEKCTECGALESIPGDVNDDGKINSLDGLLLMRYLNGWNVDIASPEAMDVNADGKVNSLDGLILMRYLNGWNVTLG